MSQDVSRQEAPRQEAYRQDNPRQEPALRNEPVRQDPPRQENQRQESPRPESSRSDSRRSETAPRRSRRREEPDLRAEDDVSALPAFLTAAPRPAAAPVAERFVEPAGEAEPKRESRRRGDEGRFSSGSTEATSSPSSSLRGTGRLRGRQHERRRYTLHRRIVCKGPAAYSRRGQPDEVLQKPPSHVGRLFSCRRQKSCCSFIHANRNRHGRDGACLRRRPISPNGAISQIQE